MSEEMDNVLRKSLDEVGRARKMQWLYLAACFLLLLLFIASARRAALALGDPRLAGEFTAGAMVVVLTNVFVILGLSLFISRMTSKILKAIDLATKR